MLIELNEENFDKETKNGLKLVEFYTPWCTYCRNQRIELQELEDSDMWIGLLDSDECPEIAKRYGIKGYPTFILLKMVKKLQSLLVFIKKLSC